MYVRFDAFHVVQRRKLVTTTSHPGNLPNGQSPFLLPSPQRYPTEIEEEESGDEVDPNAEWNWRDDSKWVEFVYLLLK